ncbi:MAG: type II toxin-antitoxin system Phd/YefM family antitoxin [Myxococcales bacterium]|nr:type II toxin-antitoxin system Phd/YefM family antitoxin [Myxococcales bacterium]
MSKVVNVQDAKTRLSQLLRLVEAGEEISIARSGRVIARLVRADEAAPREWGAFRGQVRWDDDAFAPLSDEEMALWEGSAPAK